MSVNADLHVVNKTIESDLRRKLGYKRRKKISINTVIIGEDPKPLFALYGPLNTQKDSRVLITLGY